MREEGRKTIVSLGHSVDLPCWNSRPDVEKDTITGNCVRVNTNEEGFYGFRK